METRSIANYNKISQELENISSSIGSSEFISDSEDISSWSRYQLENMDIDIESVYNLNEALPLLSGSDESFSDIESNFWENFTNTENFAHIISDSSEDEGNIEIVIDDSYEFMVEDSEDDVIIEK